MVSGLIGGLFAVTLTDKSASWFGVPWGAYPLTIHSAGWGIVFNLLTTVVVSFLTRESNSRKNIKANKHKLLQTVSGMSDIKK